MEQRLRRDKLSMCQLAQMWLALQAGAAQLLFSVEVTPGSSREMAHNAHDSQGCGWCYMQLSIDRRCEHQGTKLLKLGTLFIMMSFRAARHCQQCLQQSQQHQLIDVHRNSSLDLFRISIDAPAMRAHPLYRMSDDLPSIEAGPSACCM